MTPVLLLTPRGDVAAETAAEWARQALGSHRQLQHLDNGAVTRDALARYLQAGQDFHQAVFYFGHGRRDEWHVNRTQGSQSVFERLVLHSDEASCLGQAPLVFAVACYSSAGLGLAAVKAGVRMYVGFNRAVSWAPDIPYTARALGRCIEDLVSAALEISFPLSAAVVSERLAAVVDRHQRYWDDLRRRADARAEFVLKYLNNLRVSLEVHENPSPTED